MANQTLTIEMESGKVIPVELFNDLAPYNVDYFLSYVNTGYYDGLPFHTCIKDEYIQCGFYAKSGYGAPAFSYEEDDKEAQPDQDIPPKKGMIALIKAKYPYVAKLQFAILLSDAPLYSEGHEILFTPVGQVTNGMDLVNVLADADVDEEYYPIDVQIVKKVSVQ